MNKLKLVGVRNIPLDEGEEIDPNADYLIALMAQREGVYQPDPQGDEEEPVTYTLRVSKYEEIKKVGEAKSVDFEQGYSESQKTRFAIEKALAEAGINNENDEGYKKIQEWLRRRLKNENSREKILRAVFE